MIQKTLTFFVLFTVFAFSLQAQSNKAIHTLSQSCYVTANGSVIINAGGQHTTSASEQIYLRDSLYSSAYDTASSSFKNNKRQYFSYDAGGLLTSASTKTIDKSGTTWSNSQLTEYGYTGFQLFEETTKSWEKTTSVWKNFVQNKYTYLADNSLQSIIYFSWDETNAEWDYNSKDLVTLNAGKVSSISNQKYNVNLNSWENFLRINFTYTGGLVTELLFQSYDKSTQTWTDYQKETISYASSKISESITQVKSGSSAWENYSRKTYTHIETGPESITEYLWFASWKENRKYTYTYDNNQLLTRTLLSNWAAHLNLFREQTEDNSYFSKHEVIGINERAAETILIKNPVSVNETITPQGLKPGKSYTMQLISVSGSQIMLKNISSGESFTMPAGIQKGIYLLRISSSNEKTMIQKIVVAD